MLFSSIFPNWLQPQCFGYWFSQSDGHWPCMVLRVNAVQWKQLAIGPPFPIARKPVEIYSEDRLVYQQPTGLYRSQGLGISKPISVHYFLPRLLVRHLFGIASVVICTESLCPLQQRSRFPASSPTTPSRGPVQARSSVVIMNAHKECTPGCPFCLHSPGAPMADSSLKRFVPTHRCPVLRTKWLSQDWSPYLTPTSVPLPAPTSLSIGVRCPRTAPLHPGHPIETTLNETRPFSASK